MSRSQGNIDAGWRLSFRAVPAMVAGVALVAAVLALARLALGEEFPRSAPPEGWKIGGESPQDYQFVVDSEVKRSGKKSGVIRARVVDPSGNGSLNQAIASEKYRGKRVRFSGYLKTRDVKWAGLYMEVQGVGKLSLAFDNMQDRIIKGTTNWKRYEVVLDVPEHAVRIGYGLQLFGTGQVWADGLALEVVDKSVPVTDLLSGASGAPREPANLGFEQ